jgi:ribosomal protein L31
MSAPAHDHPRCNVHVNDVDQCGDEAVAKETIQEDEIELDVWYCVDHLHLHLADDAETV